MLDPNHIYVFSISQTRRQLSNRDMRTTWTLCLLCCCYIIFVGPIVLSTLTGVQGQLNLLCFILYWFQYSTNFIIYAAKSEQYRRAYRLYLRTCLPWLLPMRRDSQVFVIQLSHHQNTDQSRSYREVLLQAYCPHTDN